MLAQTGNGHGPIKWRTLQRTKISVIYPNGSISRDQNVVFKIQFSEELLSICQFILYQLFVSFAAHLYDDDTDR